jgi:hypothetical protein
VRDLEDAYRELAVFHKAGVFDPFQDVVATAVACERILRWPSAPGSDWPGSARYALGSADRRRCSGTTDLGVDWRVANPLVAAEG